MPDESILEYPDGRVSSCLSLWRMKMKNYDAILKENIYWARETFAKIDGKFSKVTLRSRDKLSDGVDKNGFHISKSPSGWTSGFWGGLNHLLYNYTKNEEYLKTARRSEELMDPALVDFAGLYHDVGFMWHILSGANYRLYGDEMSKNRNLHAAASLFSRYVLSGGFIRAWNGHWGDENVENWTIIDCLMNLPILYWASEVLHDDRFTQIAKAHADMAIRDHVRPDGSVAHIVEHDRETGEPVATYAGQGYAVGSSWSRGQAWGIYGFVISYKHTRDEKYLDAAKRIANYFIANCSDDWLPRVDFRAPSEPVYYDSTAGAIAACGLIEIAKEVGENEGGAFLNAAINLLRALDKSFADYSPENDAMLGYGTVRYPSRKEYLPDVHISIIYGDYYFTEAILKLLGADFDPWMK